MNQVTHECLGQNLSPSTYGWKDEMSQIRLTWSKFKVQLPTGGRMNQATHECLGQSLNPSTYGWKDEPSHIRVT